MTTLYEVYRNCTNKDEFMTRALQAYGSKCGSGSIFKFIGTVIDDNRDDLIEMIHSILDYRDEKELKKFFMRKLEIEFYDFVNEDYIDEHREEIEELDCEVA